MAKIAFWLVLVASCHLLPYFCNTTSADNFILEAHPERINTVSTRNFTVNCNFQSKENIKIVSMLLLKRTGKGAQTTKTIASLTNKPDSHVYSSPKVLPGANYTGRISKNKGFLLGKWTIIPQCISGTYTCIVNILDNLGHLRKMQKSVNVVEEEPNRRDVLAALKELQKFDQSVSFKLAKIQMLVKMHHLIDPLMEIKCCASAKQSGHESLYVAFTHKEQLTHSWARDYCKKIGGYLMELNDDVEWEAVVKFLDEEYPGYYIAGVRGTNDKSKFYWTRTGNEIARSSHWGPQGANNAGGRENCLELWRPIQWRLNDVGCWGRRSFICEIPIR